MSSVQLGWIERLQSWPNPQPRRWSDAELGELQSALLLAGLPVISDAIGSLMFDKAELFTNLETLRGGVDRTA